MAITIQTERELRKYLFETFLKQQQEKGLLKEAPGGGSPYPTQGSAYNGPSPLVQDVINSEAFQDLKNVWRNVVKPIAKDAVSSKETNFENTIYEAYPSGFKKDRYKEYQKHLTQLRKQVKDKGSYYIPDGYEGESKDIQLNRQKFFNRINILIEREEGLLGDIGPATTMNSLKMTPEEKLDQVKKWNQNYLLKTYFDLKTQKYYFYVPLQVYKKYIGENKDLSFFDNIPTQDYQMVNDEFVFKNAIFDYDIFKNKEVNWHFACLSETIQDIKKNPIFNTKIEIPTFDEETSRKIYGNDKVGMNMNTFMKKYGLPPLNTFQSVDKTYFEMIKNDILQGRKLLNQGSKTDMPPILKFLNPGSGINDLSSDRIQTITNQATWDSLETAFMVFCDELQKIYNKYAFAVQTEQFKVIRQNLYQAQANPDENVTELSDITNTAGTVTTPIVNLQAISAFVTNYKTDPDALRKQLESAFGDFDMQLLSQLMQNKRINDDAARWVGSYALDDSKKDSKLYETLAVNPGKYIFKEKYDKLTPEEKDMYVVTQWSPDTVIRNTSTGQAEKIQGYEKEERGTDWLLDKFFAWDSGKSFFNFFFRSFNPKEIQMMAQDRGENFQELADDTISSAGVQSYVDAVNIASSFMVGSATGPGLIVSGATSFASWWNRGGYINFLEDKIEELDEAQAQLAQVEETVANKKENVIVADRADGILNDIKKNGINIGKIQEFEITDLSVTSKMEILKSVRSHLRQTEYLEQLFWFIEMFGWVPILSTHLKCSLLSRLTTRTDDLLASQKPHVISVPVKTGKWVNKSDSGEVIDDLAYNELDNTEKSKYSQEEIIEYQEVHIDPNSYYEISNFIPGSGHETQIVAAMDDVMEKLYLNLFIPLREIVEPNTVSKFRVNKNVSINLTNGAEIDREIYDLIYKNHRTEMSDFTRKKVYTRPGGLSKDAQETTITSEKFDEIKDDNVRNKYTEREVIVFEPSDKQAKDFDIYRVGDQDLENKGINDNLKLKLRQKGVDFNDPKHFTNLDTNYDYTFSELSEILLKQEGITADILIKNKIPLYENMAVFAKIFKTLAENTEAQAKLSIDDIKKLFFEFYNLNPDNFPNSKDFFDRVIDPIKKSINNMYTYSDGDMDLSSLAGLAEYLSIRSGYADDLITFLKLNDITVADDIVEKLKNGQKIQDNDFLKNVYQYFKSINSANDLDAVYGIRFLKYNFEFIKSGKEFPKKANYAYKLIVKIPEGADDVVVFPGTSSKWNPGRKFNRYKKDTQLTSQQFDELVQTELPEIYKSDAYQKANTLEEKWNVIKLETDETAQAFAQKFEFKQPEKAGGHTQYRKDLEEYLQKFSRSRLNQLNYMLNYVIKHQYSQQAAFANLAKKPIQEALKYLNNLDDFMHTGTVQVSDATLSTIFESLNDVLINMEQYCNWLQFAKTTDDGLPVPKINMYRELSASGAQKFKRSGDQTIDSIYKTFEEMRRRLKNTIKGNFQIDKIEKIAGQNIASHKAVYSQVYLGRLNRIFQDMQNYPKTFAGFKESLDNVQKALKEIDEYLKANKATNLELKGSSELVAFEKMLADLNNIINNTVTELNNTPFFSKAGFNMNEASVNSIFKSAYHINEYSRQVFVRLTKSLIQIGEAWNLGFAHRFNDVILKPILSPITDFIKEFWNFNKLIKGKSFSDYDWQFEWSRIVPIITQTLHVINSFKVKFPQTLKEKGFLSWLSLNFLEITCNIVITTIRFGLNHPLLSVTALKIYNDWTSIQNLDEFEDIKTHWEWKKHVMMPLVYSLLARAGTSVILSKNVKLSEQFSSLFKQKIGIYLSTYLKQLYLFKRKLILAKHQRIELNSKQRFAENIDQLQAPTPTAYRSKSEPTEEITTEEYKALKQEEQGNYQPTYSRIKIPEDTINTLLEDFQKQNLILSKANNPEIKAFITKYTVDNPDNSQYQFLTARKVNPEKEQKNQQILLKTADKDKNGNAGQIHYIQIPDNENSRLDLSDYQHIGSVIEKDFNTFYGQTALDFNDLFDKKSETLTNRKNQDVQAYYHEDSGALDLNKKDAIPAINLTLKSIDDITTKINNINTTESVYTWNKNINTEQYANEIVIFLNDLREIVASNQSEYHVLSSNIFKHDNYLIETNDDKSKKVVLNSTSLSEQYASIINKLYKTFYLPSLSFGKKHPEKFKLHFYWATIINKTEYAQIPDIRLKLSFLDFWARHFQTSNNKAENIYEQWSKLSIDNINSMIGFLKEFQIDSNKNIGSLLQIDENNFLTLIDKSVSNLAVANSKYFEKTGVAIVDETIDTAQKITNDDIESLLKTCLSLFNRFIKTLHLTINPKNMLPLFITYLESLFLIKRCNKIQETLNSIRNIMDVKELEMSKKLIDNESVSNGDNQYKIMDHQFDIKSMLTNGLNSVLYKSAGNDVSKTGIRINPIFYNADQPTNMNDKTYLDLIGGNNNNPLDTLFINNIRAITIDKNDDIFLNITKAIITIDSIIENYIEIYTQIFGLAKSVSNNELPVNITLSNDKTITAPNNIQDFNTKTDEDLTTEAVLSYRDLNKILNNQKNIKKKIIKEAPKVNKVSINASNLINQEQKSRLKVNVSDKLKDFDQNAFQQYLDKKKQGVNSLQKAQQESVISNLRAINKLVLSTNYDINYNLNELVDKKNNDNLNLFFKSIELTLDLIDSVPMIDINIESGVVLLKRMLGLKQKITDKIDQIKESIDEEGEFAKILKEINPVKFVAKKEEKAKIKNVFDNYLDKNSLGNFKNLNNFVSTNDKNSTSESVIKLKFARMLYISIKFLMPMIKEINNRTENNKIINLSSLMDTFETNLKNMYSNAVESQRVELTEYLSFFKKLTQQNMKDLQINDYSYVIGYEFDDISNRILKIYVLSDISNFKTEKNDEFDFTNIFMLDIPYIYEINLEKNVNFKNLNLTKNDLIKDTIIIKLAEENRYISIPNNSLKFEVYKFDKNKIDLIKSLIKSTLLLNNYTKPDFIFSTENIQNLETEPTTNVNTSSNTTLK